MGLMFWIRKHRWVLCNHLFYFLRFLTQLYLFKSSLLSSFLLSRSLLLHSSLICAWWAVAAIFAFSTSFQDTPWPFMNFSFFEWEPSSPAAQDTSEHSVVTMSSTFVNQAFAVDFCLVVSCRYQRVAVFQDLLVYPAFWDFKIQVLLFTWNSGFTPAQLLIGSISYVASCKTLLLILPRETAFPCSEFLLYLCCALLALFFLSSSFFNLDRHLSNFCLPIFSSPRPEYIF